MTITASEQSQKPTAETKSKEGKKSQPQRLNLKGKSLGRLNLKRKKHHRETTSKKATKKPTAETKSKNLTFTLCNYMVHYTHQVTF